MIYRALLGCYYCCFISIRFSSKSAVWIKYSRDVDFWEVSIIHDYFSTIKSQEYKLEWLNIEQIFFKLNLVFVVNQFHREIQR